MKRLGMILPIIALMASAAFAQQGPRELAGVADEAWGDLPMPMLSNPRVRFWFTERGWRAYGLRVAAEARASGRAFRVVRRKNPARSMVVYRDDWQVALLPDRD